MALVTGFSKVQKERQSLQRPAKCEYSVFKHDGSTYLQLDIHGSAGEPAQSLQLDRAAARALRQLMEEIGISEW